MAKKINMSAVKEFMFNHGEKVALGTCAFLALVFGGLGLLRAMSAGKADNSSNGWVAELQLRKNVVETSMRGLPAPTLPEGMEPKLQADFYQDGWKTIKSTHVPTPYMFFSGGDSLKRLNPLALAIKDQPDLIKVDYVPGLVWVHEVQGNTVKGLVAAEGGGGVMVAGQPKVPPMGPMGIKGAASEIPAFLKGAEPVRMVVVTAMFPMKLQMEEFQRALKLLTQKDLFDNREDLPKILGINVRRFELVNGQIANKEGEILLQYDPKTQKLTKAAKLDRLLQMAIYDEETPAMLEQYIYEGLVTPMPKFANARYPQVKFPGMEIAVDEEGEPKKVDVAGGPPPIGKGGPPPMPKTGVMLPGGDKMKSKMPMMPEAPGTVLAGEKKMVAIKAKDLEKQDPALYERLFKKNYNIYHVLGLFPPQEGAAAKKDMGVAMPNQGAVDQGRYFSAFDLKAGGGMGGAAMPPRGSGGPPPIIGRPPVFNKGPGPMPMPMPMGNAPGVEVFFPAWEHDALVRFVDPDVVPGKTYQYAIQVRLANPNYKRSEVTAFASLAEVKEIASEWKYTPTVSIPGEYFVYGVDQHLLDDIAAEKIPAKGKGPKNDPNQLAKDQAAFQIHQWTTTAPDDKNNTLLIGDWAIAERVAVRRGEIIGSQALVQVPAWYKEKDSFEVPAFTFKDAKKNITTKPGLKMDFRGDTEPPVLVDFVGGKRYKGNTPLVEEETAVEALIVSADGKLSVLNSRVDSDASLDPAKERHERVIRARDRIVEVSNQNAGVVDPKGPPGMKLPGMK